MTGNGCISLILPIKYELKLPSEATPTSFAIQNQIQAVCLAFIPQTNYYSYAMLHKSSNFLFYAHISRTPAVCQNEGHCTK